MVSIEIVRREQTQGSIPVHDDALVANLLANRGVTDASELEFSLKRLPSPDLLLDIDKAVELLSRALAEQQRILIVGDYDCDGATSTALAVLALRAMGATQVDYLLPNRFEHGYGLSVPIVELAAKHDPQLIITVDNGIASVEGVECARQLGIDVLVTDHHLPPAVLPRAAALINPNIPGARFPSGNIAGVGVIFFVMIALRTRLRESGWFSAQSLQAPNLATLLDLVAIGTVADVVPLDEVNRTLVEQGIRRIRAGQTRPGVLALLERAGKPAEKLVSQDIGFSIGPRLNAAGRLADMRIGVECLLTDDAQRAAELASELHTLNTDRRALEAEMRNDTEEVVSGILEGLQTGAGGMLSLCLYESHWHEGVIGILAGRLKDSLHRPVIIFAPSANARLKGSARSIPGLHIYDALKGVRTENPHLFDKFGGHAMAAGLDIAANDFAEFSNAFEAEVNRRLDGRLPGRQLESDGELTSSQMSMDTANTLKWLAPWGQGFPEPLFDNYFVVASTRVLKERHLKLALQALGGSQANPMTLDAIWFGAVSPGEPAPFSAGDQVRVAYRLDINSFRGNDSLQLMVQHIEQYDTRVANDPIATNPH